MRVKNFFASNLSHSIGDIADSGLGECILEECVVHPSQMPLYGGFVSGRFQNSPVSNIWEVTPDTDEDA